MDELDKLYYDVQKVREMFQGVKDNIVDIYIPKGYNIIKVYVANDPSVKARYRSRKVGEVVLKNYYKYRRYATVISHDILYTIDRDTHKVTRKVPYYTLMHNGKIYRYVSCSSIHDTPPFYQFQIKWEKNSDWIDMGIPKKNIKKVERDMNREKDEYYDRRIIYVEE